MKKQVFLKNTFSNTFFKIFLIIVSMSTKSINKREDKWNLPSESNTLKVFQFLLF